MRAMVYGLPRTGTNYLEYLIRYNTDCRQDCTVEHSEYVDFIEGPVCSSKHCKPRLNGADLYVIIIKSPEAFISSFSKYYLQWEVEFKREKLLDIYSRALYDYIEFQHKNSLKVTIVLYEQLLGNEREFLERLRIKSNYNFTIEDKLNVPNKRMFHDGGHTMTEEDFICTKQ